MCIPKCTSTQHPDNVFLPFFAEDKVLGGEDEVQEAFYVLSHLVCSRNVGGVKPPRAIGFTAALYSLGLPH